MTDIFDIKNALSSFPFFWQVIYAIPAAFLLVFIWKVLWKWRKTKESLQTKIFDPKIYAEEKIALLSIDDPRYIQKLDFVVRKYLELTGVIVKWTRKTATEISRVEIGENIRTFIMMTNRYKYAPEKVNQQEKENLLRMARGIIEE